ncbi:MAG TPA: hypothetical protein PKK00_06645 [Bacteroidales bacterium]|mgnify:CR=1 FL=1|nr:hypothetical protein [Bacteroidales bacterium]HPS16992.1 hypothetical protein [Bacteroidales bacterium]
MKTNFFKLVVIFTAAVALSISGCKKDRDENDETNSNSLQQLSKDEVAIENATGDVLKDANSVLSGNSGKAISQLPCNVTIDSTSIVNDTIIYSITYNGLNCAGNLYRVGNAQVKKNINTHWCDAGAKVTISLINLKITRVSDQKWVILNGTKTYENVTGGFLIQLGTAYTTIIHKAIGTLQATFDDNTTRTWNLARQITYTGTIGLYVITEDGLGSADGYDNLVCWGKNRDDNHFYTQITTSTVFKQACGWDPCSGVKVHQIPDDQNKKATVTFGYDNTNQLITNGDCPTRFRLDWEMNGTNGGTIYLALP